MIRFMILGGAIVAVLIVTAAIMGWPAGGSSTATPPTLTAGQIQQLASLVTTRIEVTAVVARRLEGVTGSLRTVIAVRGEVLLCVDLSDARLKEVDAQRCTAVLVVPKPRVLSVSLDHEHTTVHSLRATGTWLLLPAGAGRGELLTMALHEAQQQLASEASSTLRLDAARQHAEEVIEAFAKSNFGWRLIIHWE